MFNNVESRASYSTLRCRSLTLNKNKIFSSLQFVLFFAKGFKVLLPATTSRKCAHGCTELVRMDFNIQSGILKFRTPSLMNPFGVWTRAFGLQNEAFYKANW